MTKSDDYLWDRSGDVDPEVERLEKLMSPLRHDVPLDELRLRRRKSRLPMILGGLVAAAAMLAVVVWWRSGTGSTACSGAGFAFTAKGGDVACEGASLASGVLPVGGTLDTGANQADLAIATIGTAELGANTRVRLDHTRANSHQLYLERGRMHAKVNALPKIFAVATPSTQVTDLGCEYVLDIDDRGAGSIRVITGRVELEPAKNVTAVVPRGAHARLLPGRRSGLPLANSASSTLITAARAYEDGVPGAIAPLLAATTKRDAITVAHLGKFVPEADKRSVLVRLAELSPAPQDLTIDEMLAAPDLYEMWFDDVIDKF